jgi:hypothetical protein
MLLARMRLCAVREVAQRQPAPESARVKNTTRVAKFPPWHRGVRYCRRYGGYPVWPALSGGVSPRHPAPVTGAQHAPDQETGVSASYGQQEAPASAYASANADAATTTRSSANEPPPSAGDGEGDVQHDAGEPESRCRMSPLLSTTIPRMRISRRLSRGLQDAVRRLGGPIRPEETDRSATATPDLRRSPVA